MREQLAELWAILELIYVIPEPNPSPGPTPPDGRGHMETVVADGLIVTPYGPVPRSVSEAIMGHFPREVWTDAGRVAHGESGWRYNAIRSTLDRAGGRCGVLLGYLPNGMAYYSEESVGIFQINRCSHGGTKEYWEDIETNVKKAGQLYAEKGWYPWIATATTLELIGDS